MINQELLNETQKLITQVCDEVKDELINKNRKYGNSVLQPKRVFSNADVVSQINTRIDDKLSRIMSGQLDEDEDVEFDLIGYLIIKRVAKILNKKGVVE